jgi:hypothetical protein
MSTIFVSLNSLINRSIDIFSLGNKQIDVSSEANKTILIDSYTGADEVTEKLRYEDIKPTSKVVGKKYQIQRPPLQRI